MKRFNDSNVRSWAAQSVLQKTNRLLGWDSKGRVVVVPPEGVRPDAGLNASYPPAYTDGTTITINANSHRLIWDAFKKGFSPESLMIITGLNYHELAHCFFTPRIDSAFVRAIQKKGHFISLNALEDQGAESKFVRLYNPARHYFTSVISQLMAVTPDVLKINYPLIAGRRFLPADIRRMFRDAFVRQDLLGDFDRIIDRYCDCVFPDDQGEMTNLVEEYHDLMLRAVGRNDYPKLLTAHGVPPDRHTNPTEGMHKGKPLSGEEVRRVVGISPVGEKLEPNKTEQSDEKPDPNNPSGPKAGTYKGDAEKSLAETKDLSKALKDAQSEAHDQVAEEVGHNESAIKDTERNYQVTGQVGRSTDHPVTSEHLNAAHQVEREFRRLNQKFKAGWNRRQESGKLNINDLARIRRGQTDVFKRFYPGVNNALSFEVVILLDQSGSMSGSMREAGSALWVLHRAMKRLGGEVTVVGYSDASRCFVLMQRGEKTPSCMREFSAGGSTYIMPALKEARRILGVSRKPLKLCVVITDGHFSDSREAKQWMKNSHHPLAVVGINHDVRRLWNPDEIRQLKTSREITRPMDLVPFVKDLVIRLANERFAKR